MSQGPMYIEVEPTDHLASVRGKLDQVQGETIVLVASKRASWLRNPVLLRALQRIVARQGRPVYLLAEDRKVRALAREAGLRLVDRAALARRDSRTPAASAGRSSLVLMGRGLARAAQAGFALAWWAASHLWALSVLAWRSQWAQRARQRLQAAAGALAGQLLTTRPGAVLAAKLHAFAAHPSVRAAYRVVGGAATGGARALASAGVAGLRQLPRLARYAPGIAVAAAVIVGAVALWIAALLLFASASVTMVLPTEGHTEVLDVTAVAGLPEVRPAEGRVPGRLVETTVEITERTATTGRRSEPDRPAQGRVTFVSRVPEAIVIPPGVRVATATGIEFRTTTAAALPPLPGSMVNVNVVAVQPGAAGNVPPTSIDRVLDPVLETKVAVLQEEATRDGSDRELRLVTAADQERVRQQAQARLNETAREAVMALRRPSESLYAEAVRVTLLEERFDRQVNDEAPELSVRMRARASAVAFEGARVNAMAIQRLEAERRASVIREEFSTRPLEMTDSGEDWVSFRLQTEALLAPRIEEERVREVLAGKQLDEAVSYLTDQFPLLEPARISLQPALTGRLPLVPQRIQVHLISRAPEGPES